MVATTVYEALELDMDIFEIVSPSLLKDFGLTFDPSMGDSTASSRSHRYISLITVRLAGKLLVLWECW